MSVITLLRNIQKIISNLFIFFLIFAVFFLEPHINLYYKNLIYTTSLCIKIIIMDIMPFIIIFFIASALINIKNKAIECFIVVIIFIILSNFISIIFGYVFGNILYSDEAIHIQNHNIQSLKPLFEINSLKLINSIEGLAIGLLLGICSIALKGKKESSFPIALDIFIEKCNNIAIIVIKYFITPLIPILVIGIMIKFLHEYNVQNVFNMYKTIFIAMLCGQITYLILLLALNVTISKISILKILNALMPAITTAFSSMSSIITMPITLSCCNKIAKNSKIIKLFIPATVNMHLVSSAISFNVLCIILSNCQNCLSVQDVVLYALQLSLLMLGATGISGGFVFIAIPLISTVFGLDSQITSLLIVLIIIFDPFDTAANVSANILMVNIFEKFYIIYNRLKKRII